MNVQPQGQQADRLLTLRHDAWRHYTADELTLISWLLLRLYQRVIILPI